MHGLNSIFKMSRKFKGSNDFFVFVMASSLKDQPRLSKRTSKRLIENVQIQGSRNPEEGGVH
jgi:hypothetical protein